MTHELDEYVTDAMWTALHSAQHELAEVRAALELARQRATAPAPAAVGDVAAWAADKAAAEYEKQALEGLANVKQAAVNAATDAIVQARRRRRDELYSAAGQRLVAAQEEWTALSAALEKERRAVGSLPLNEGLV